MHLIAGLGNPGGEYRLHRHNIGFMAIDAIARYHNFSPFKSKFNGLIAEGTIEGERFLLLKPQTFMNKSGTSLGAATKFYKIMPSDITVVYDELDLGAGKVKVKTGGGNGGHNGLRSIDPVIGKEYQRVRLGIGHPGHKDLVSRHVLGNFAKSDAQWREELLDAVAKNVHLLATENGAGKFMNKISLATGAATPIVKPTPKTNKSSTPLPASEKAKPQSPKAEAKSRVSTGPMAAMLKKLFATK